MIDQEGTIEVLELKRLLVELSEKNPNVCVRLRLIGEMWMPHFMRIVKVTEKGVLLYEEANNHVIAVQNISQVVQFELDNRYQHYEPYFHYGIKLSKEFV